MEGGSSTWKKPTRKEIEQSNMLSMFRAETHNFNYFLPFYPLPFRTKSGAIMFPADVRGVWMRDDVVGAFKYFDKFSSLGRLSHGVPGGSKPETWTPAHGQGSVRGYSGMLKDGKSAYVFDRQQYVTVGAALARNPPPPSADGEEKGVGAFADRLVD